MWPRTPFFLPLWIYFNCSEFKCELENVLRNICENTIAFHLPSPRASTRYIVSNCLTAHDWFSEILAGSHKVNRPQQRLTRKVAFSRQQFWGFWQILEFILPRYSILDIRYSILDIRSPVPMANASPSNRRYGHSHGTNKGTFSYRLSTGWRTGTRESNPNSETKFVRKFHKCARTFLIWARQRFRKWARVSCSNASTCKLFSFCWLEEIHPSEGQGRNWTQSVHASIQHCVDTVQRALVATLIGYLASRYRALFPQQSVRCDTVHSSFHFPVSSEERPTTNRTLISSLLTKFPWFQQQFSIMSYKQYKTSHPDQLYCFREMRHNSNQYKQSLERQCKFQAFCKITHFPKYITLTT